MLSSWRMYEMHLALFLKARCDTMRAPSPLLSLSRAVTSFSLSSTSLHLSPCPRLDYGERLLSSVELVVSSSLLPPLSLLPLADPLLMQARSPAPARLAPRLLRPRRGSLPACSPRRVQPLSRARSPSAGSNV
jgi:hypothetical protein